MVPFPVRTYAELEGPKAALGEITVADTRGVGCSVTVHLRSTGPTFVMQPRLRQGWQVRRSQRGHKRRDLVLRPQWAHGIAG